MEADTGEMDTDEEEFGTKQIIGLVIFGLLLSVVTVCFTVKLVKYSFRRINLKKEKEQKLRTKEMNQAFQEYIEKSHKMQRTITLKPRKVSFSERVQTVDPMMASRSNSN